VWEDSTCHYHVKAEMAIFCSFTEFVPHKENVSVVACANCVVFRACLAAAVYIRLIGIFLCLQTSIVEFVDAQISTHPTTPTATPSTGEEESRPAEMDQHRLVEAVLPEGDPQSGVASDASTTTTATAVSDDSADYHTPVTTDRSEHHNAHAGSEDQRPVDISLDGSSSTGEDGGQDVWREPLSGQTEAGSDFNDTVDAAATPPGGTPDERPAQPQRAQQVEVTHEGASQSPAAHEDEREHQHKRERYNIYADLADLRRQYPDFDMVQFARDFENEQVEGRISWYVTKRDVEVMVEESIALLEQDEAEYARQMGQGGTFPHDGPWSGEALYDETQDPEVSYDRSRERYDIYKDLDRIQAEHPDFDMRGFARDFEEAQLHGEVPWTVSQRYVQMLVEESIDHLEWDEAEQQRQQQQQHQETGQGNRRPSTRKAETE
jgi:hypothetical protein